MHLEKIYELGDMLGLNQKDIRKLLSNKQTTENPITINFSLELYKHGMYGTVSIKDL